MDEPKKFIIQCDVSTQVTEDTWKLKRRTLRVFSDTTIAEVEKWLSGIREPLDIRILELEATENP